MNLVVGAGFSGAVIANLLSEKLNEKVLIIDRRNHIAGNCYDWIDGNITIHKYGSHIFHTNNKKVWQYLNRFCAFNSYRHKVLAQVDNKKINIPFNLNSLYQAFNKDFAQKIEKKLLDKFEYNSKISILDLLNETDDDIEKVAKFIYEKIFYNYTLKQWGCIPDKIDKNIFKRVPLILSNEDGYFQDEFQGIPILGYTKLIENILNNKNIEIKLNTDFKDIKDNSFKRIIYTGSIDEFFEYKFGILPYRSLEFEFEELNCEFYQENSVINYPNEEKYTRIHEFKYYLNEKSPKTIISKEFPLQFELGKNERFYPVENKENINLYNKYLKEAKKYKNLYFLGRLGNYKYYNMDCAIISAFELFEKIN